MKPIFLVGYMGVGKSSIGKMLAKSLGRKHIDLDWWIAQRFHCTIKDMFAEIGEEGFRKREKAMLEEVIGIEDVVISSGGGTPCYFDNMQMMNESGKTIYLRGDVDTIVKHVTSAHSNRPMLEGKTEEEIEIFVRGHMAEREPYYNQAQIVADVAGKRPEEIIKEIINKINE